MSETNYSLKAEAGGVVAAPDLPYQPPRARSYRPRMALIGCGGITVHHLDAARAHGVEVVAFVDPDLGRAEKRRAETNPAATVHRDHREVLSRPDIEVVDIATHPAERAQLIEDALMAGKHVLSQKPFVLDLAVGRRLVELADRQGRRLAVNQNGRWAPYFSYLRQAVRAGLLGSMQSLELAMNWDHTWVKGTPFERIHHVVLYDFAIHWFDIAAEVFAGRAARRVYAAAVRAASQELAPPMVASAVVEFEGGLATLAFDAHCARGAEERLVAVGRDATLRGSGPLCGIPRLQWSGAAGEAVVELGGAWFPGGFHGTLGELLSAIEEDREPSNSARNNLRSLEICFAALRSADTGEPQVPGTVRTAGAGSAATRSS